MLQRCRPPIRILRFSAERIQTFSTWIPLAFTTTDVIPFTGLGGPRASRRQEVGSLPDQGGGSVYLYLSWQSSPARSTARSTCDVAGRETSRVTSISRVDTNETCCPPLPDAAISHRL